MSRLVELYPLAATRCTFSVKRRSTPRTAGGRVGQRDDPYGWGSIWRQLTELDRTGVSDMNDMTQPLYTNTKTISDDSNLPGSEFAMRPRARSSALLVLQKCPRCLGAETMPKKRNTVEARLVMLVSSFQAADSGSQGVRGLISS